ncbi:MAG: TIGR03790 family protein [Candidatus Auribacter fodinae]|uniref:TIGR03790 family protein n=1 Tax=Candidatus Auribacter fodinae TaxID=2093366 RepID=A0A3A4R4M1_9BACT|nr:MAG: TIGR03790 family protein [Candidatus Auribacter fodinae]
MQTRRHGHRNRKNFLSNTIVILIVCICRLGAALEPDQVLVVYNGGNMESVRLAEYYRDKRGIPQKNMCYIMCPASEDIPRDIYDERLKSPVEKYLEENNLKDTILCIVLMYGIPMKIYPAELRPLEKEYTELTRLIADKQKFLNTEEEILKLQQEADALKEKIKGLYDSPTKSSVDSELTLIFRGSYRLEHQMMNPYYFFPDKKFKPFSREYPMYMVSRLDAPDADLVIPMIDKAVFAEQNGLEGNAYFDARGFQADASYGQMDEYIRTSAQMTEHAGFKTVLDNQPTLFPEGACPDTAIYWGWYSLQNYIDSFTFKPGAIGVHVASIECNTLKGNKNIWCLQMIKKGVTATAGPVSEPYLNSFPNPVVFLGALFEGYSLAEAYFISSPYLSWRMVLIGDPLYTPYKNHKPGRIQAEASNDSK